LVGVGDNFSLWAISAPGNVLALESGEIDAVMTDLIVTGLMKKGGTDVKVVAIALGATPQEGRFAVLAAPNSGIASVDDLQGIPIAISNNTIIHYLAEKMSEEVGLSAEEIKTQSIPDLKVRLEALLAGKDVKAALLPDPLASLAEKAGARVIIDDTQLATNLSQSVIVFRNDVINKRKEAVANVMKAHQEAAQLLNTNPEKYRQLIIKNARVPETLVQTYTYPTYTPGALPTVEMVERVMEWMVKKDLLEKPYTYKEIIDDSFFME